MGHTTKSDERYVISCADMAIPERDVKMLWGRAGSCCSIPACRRELSPTGHNPYVLGEMAHIVDKSTDGPRGSTSIPESKLDSYSNLILICPTHHAIIDKDPGAYPVDLLRRLKAAHEEWVRLCLDGAGNPAWQRPSLTLGERWYPIDPADGGRVDRFGAGWMLRVPYQAAQVSDVFLTGIRQALGRMDAEGPFCRKCGVELIERSLESGFVWACDRCGEVMSTERTVESARTAVVRIGRAPVKRLWRKNHTER